MARSELDTRAEVSSGQTETLELRKHRGRLRFLDDYRADAGVTGNPRSQLSGKTVNQREDLRFRSLDVFGRAGQ